MRPVVVAGVGMTNFERPGKREWDYPEIGLEAAAAALKDSGLSYKQIEQAVVSYVYGESTSGQRAMYGLGLTGIPMYNVNNNCSSGSSALMLAWQLVGSGVAECVLAAGFEKMQPGSLQLSYQDRTAPLDRHLSLMSELFKVEQSPLAVQMFGNAGREHTARYGTTREQFAKVAEKNHRHSANNPRAQFQKVFSLDEILAAPMIHDPLTKLQCSPTSDGGAAVILCSQEFAERNRVRLPKVVINSMAMATDTPESFDTASAIDLVGATMSRVAAHKAFEQASIGPEDAQVIELHDCFSTNELITYEALGLCKPGEGGRLIDEGQTTYGGRWVVNPSGGLISKGHPLGATGLAQCAELTWQLRGEAEQRQVEGAQVAIQHNIGLGGAAVVAVYGKY